MKKIIILAFVVMTSFACEHDCENQTETCAEVPAMNEDCDAYFMRWFYDNATNTCSEIGSSGCELYGFASQEACEACICSE